MCSAFFKLHHKKDLKNYLTKNKKLEMTWNGLLKQPYFEHSMHYFLIIFQQLLDTKNCCLQSEKSILQNAAIF